MPTLNVRNKICGLLLLTCFLVIATPLNASSGYVMIASLLIGSLFLWKTRKVSKNTMTYLSLLLLSFFIFMAITITNGITVYLKNAIVMLTSMICLLPILDIAYKKNDVVVNFYIIDLLYYCLCLLNIGELLYFVWNNISNWQSRLYLENQTFLYGYHHVDFSVIIILTFLLGEKRGHRVSAIILMLISLIVLPSRTLQLFIGLYIVCMMFKKTIFNITQFNFFNTALKWFIWLIIGIVVFSYIWVFILSKTQTVLNGHDGLYDTSNFERFQTIWYAFVAIVKRHLFFRGADISNGIENLISYLDWKVTLGPHNSFFSILFFYSVFFGGVYLYGFSKLIDVTYCKDMIPFIIPYLLTACILHDMFIGVRFLFFVMILLVPCKLSSNYKIKIGQNVLIR